MANPYTSVTVSNYNTDPPSDDGSATSNNQLNWSKHKDKLGDPLKTAIEAVNSNVTTAFGKIFGATISSHATNYTVATSDQGKFLEATAAVTFTLPAAATAGDGFAVGFVNTSATTDMTIDGDSSETVNGSTSIVIPPYGYAILTSNGSLWLGFVSAETGSFTATLTGCTTSPTSTATWYRQGNFVRMTVGGMTATSNSTAMSITGLPAALRPTTTQYVPVWQLQDSVGANLAGRADVTNATNIDFSPSDSSGTLVDAGSFTASGTKGIGTGDLTLAYYLD